MNCVNLFFACDDNYAPFLAVTLASLKENRDPARQYAVRILETGLCQQNKKRLTELFSEECFTVAFVDITHKVKDVASQLFTRDYFSMSTYYRLFIPDLFPELDKALYLDSDLAVCGDISQLYDMDLGDNLVGAVPDGIINTIPELADYAVNRLRIQNPEQYFNAGVLLMNLKAMRQCDFSGMFLKLLGRVTFQVAQDQDYLNVLCRDRVSYLDYGWNTMPTGIHAKNPKLIHYNLDSKPWHRDNVPYGDLFWHYAEESGYLEQIKDIRAAYTQEQIDASAQETVNLVALGAKQAGQRLRNGYIHWKIRRVVGL